MLARPHCWGTPGSPSRCSGAFGRSRHPSQAPLLENCQCRPECIEHCKHMRSLGSAAKRGVHNDQLMLPSVPRIACVKSAMQNELRTCKVLHSILSVLHA